MGDLSKNLGPALRRLRLQRGLHQKQLARRCGLAAKTIEAFEGTSPPQDIDVLDQVLRALDADLPELLRLMAWLDAAQELDRLGRLAVAEEQAATSEEEALAACLALYVELWLGTAASANRGPSGLQIAAVAQRGARQLRHLGGLAVGSEEPGSPDEAPMTEFLIHLLVWRQSAAGKRQLRGWLEDEAATRGSQRSKSANE